MKNLKSPNVIQLLEVHETSNNVYIFQELAGDGTLKTLMKDHPQGLEEPAAIKYIIQLVNGFGELSSHGIIHRYIFTNSEISNLRTSSWKRINSNWLILAFPDIQTKWATWIAWLVPLLTWLLKFSIVKCSKSTPTSATSGLSGLSAMNWCVELCLGK